MLKWHCEYYIDERECAHLFYGGMEMTEGVYVGGWPKVPGWYDCIIKHEDGREEDCRLLHRLCVNQPSGHVWQNEMGNKIRGVVVWTGDPSQTK